MIKLVFCPWLHWFWIVLTLLVFVNVFMLLLDIYYQK